MIINACGVEAQGGADRSDVEALVDSSPGSDDPSAEEGLGADGSETAPDADGRPAPDPDDEDTALEVAEVDPVSPDVPSDADQATESDDGVEPSDLSAPDTSRPEEIGDAGGDESGPDEAPETTEVMADLGGADVELDDAGPDVGAQDAESGVDASVDASPPGVDASVDASPPDTDPTACVPACDARTCGADGCGGSCGDCALPAQCLDDGTCQRVARGRVWVERRQPNAELTALGPLETVPLVGREVIVTSAGVELGRGRTDINGVFSVALAQAPSASLQAIVAAQVLDSEGAPALAVLDAEGVTWPTQYGVVIETSKVWSWSFEATDDPLDFGDNTITASLGSGALALLATFESGQRRAADAFGAGLEELPTLGIIWSPSRTPPCLSCYLPGGWGPVVLRSPGGDVTFDRGFLISGSEASPQHWTPALLAHELGHYVMEVFSRLPSTAGAHSWNTRLWPPLAWSEGFATFFGQWSLSTPEAPISRFFTVQSDVQYWVDIEAIGSAPTNDDTSLSMTFPMPFTTGAQDQSIAEGVVAAILWDLYDDADAEPESFSLGDAVLLAISEPRLATATIDRGKLGPDLVDYLDALSCGGYASPSELLPLLFGFPWDATPACLP